MKRTSFLSFLLGRWEFHLTAWALPNFMIMGQKLLWDSSLLLAMGLGILVSIALGRFIGTHPLASLQGGLWSSSLRWSANLRTTIGVLATTGFFAHLPILAYPDMATGFPSVELAERLGQLLFIAPYPFFLTFLATLTQAALISLSVLLFSFLIFLPFCLFRKLLSFRPVTIA